jgi:hypothetical protein
MKYVAEMASGGMVYIRCLMVIGSDIKVMLSLLPLKIWEAAIFVLLMGWI